MVVGPVTHPSEVDELEEIWEWIESFDAVVESGKPGLASRILQEIRNRALAAGVDGAVYGEYAVCEHDSREPATRPTRRSGNRTKN